MNTLNTLKWAHIIGLLQGMMIVAFDSTWISYFLILTAAISSICYFLEDC